MMYIWGKMEDWYVWNMSEFYLILRWVASQWATIDIYIFLKISVDVRGRQGGSVSRLSIFMTSPGRGKPQGVFSQVGENHFHSTGCTFCTVYSQDLSKGGKQVCLVFLGGRWRRHLLHWLFNGVFFVLLITYWNIELLGSIVYKGSTYAYLPSTPWWK